MPQRTREHIIADLSVNFVDRQVLLVGHTVERWLHDYGIDLVISNYTKDGEPEAGSIFVQVKSNGSPQDLARGPFRFVPNRKGASATVANRADARDFDRLRCAARLRFLAPCTGCLFGS